MNEITETSIRSALQKSNRRLLRINDVIGTGIGKIEDELTIKVYVKKISPELERKVLRILGDFPFQLEETGKFYAF
ncbi:hypothetical protein JXB12_05625 [candidate division KSB1 bacterium]|nr:hypothetical protein [candidate division KSB1 bacterium]